MKFYSKKFRHSLKSLKNPFYKKNPSKNIVKILEKIQLNNIIKKDFKDYVIFK